MWDKPIIRLSVQSGAMTGLFYVLYFVSLYLMKVTVFDNIFNFDFLIGLGFSGITIWFFRKQINQNELRFWQGLLITFIVVWTALLVDAVAIYTSLEWVFPEFFEKSKEVQLAQLMTKKDYFVENTSEVVFNNTCERIKNASATDIIIGKMMVNSFAAFIYGIIVSIILRK